MPEVCAWGGGTTAEEQLSLPGCLSVSSASLLPYTLSHFSPMSLPDQGGGDVKKKKKRDRKKKGGDQGRTKREERNR